ncbi:phosphate acetyltransferase/phosphate butyryltransferase [Albidovulum inexpectatum]|uniref:Phosphate acetyltransferase/phosphate butyryltransferase n=1 Tax=Albidovulum inexpectatum TaxID=196587 RepID=A0A2S5JK00_9RHOB|nr:bifunctional enoyl-CoA hydratase/phosphate acetyltransferase [Albidovulum inexpectatum]PPB81780.1 phosphate acetyltransferase/phosphate butyryltransferase [Albidovulum inexpectatum]
MQFIENRTFDELAIGDSARLTRRLSNADLDLFVQLTGEANPAHIDHDYAKSSLFQGMIAHGMWGGVLVASVVATELPGPGTRLVGQRLRYLRPIGPGDRLEVEVEVIDKQAADRRVTLRCVGRLDSGETAIEGEIEVLAPEAKIRRPRAMPVNGELHAPAAHFHQMIAATHDLAPIRMAVVHPCDALSLGGAIEAASQGMIQPVLVGPRARIETAAEQAGLSLDGVEIVDAPHSHAAAETAVSLARAGKVQALMKGKLHTDELMSAAVARDTGLRTERRMSHIFALDVPHYPRLLFVTDAAINIQPDLDTKRDIVQNAIDLAHALRIVEPRVALLSAVETVYTRLPATIEAAALCKMVDRGQITGGVLDGPLAFDNAVSERAARAKGIVSPVAGRADILVVPDLEAGNMVAKQLVYLAGAESAGIVMGARVPIVLTSRADGVLSRLASCAMAQLVVAHAVQLPGSV